MGIYSSLVKAKKESRKPKPDLDKINTLIDEALEVYLSDNTIHKIHLKRENGSKIDD